MVFVFFFSCLLYGEPGPSGVRVHVKSCRMLGAPSVSTDRRSFPPLPTECRHNPLSAEGSPFGVSDVPEILGPRRFPLVVPFFFFAPGDSCLTVFTLSGSPRGGLARSTPQLPYFQFPPSPKRFFVGLNTNKPVMQGFFSSFFSGPPALPPQSSSRFSLCPRRGERPSNVVWPSVCVAVVSPLFPIRA